MKERGSQAVIVRFVPLIISAWAVVGCASGSDPDDPAVARAFDQQLHWSDLRQVIPVDMAPEDSAAMAEAFVNNWMYQQVELHHAEVNLASSQKQFETELRDYRNSLLLFAYEQALVRQKLDTLITQETIANYYQEHNANFELREDIVRARWFKVQEEDKRLLKRMEERFLSGNADQMRDIEIQLVQRGVTITDRSEVWTTMSDMRNEVPVTTLPAGSGARRFVVRNPPNTWFVDLLELRAQQSASPLELVRQDIRTTILNQRKLHLIEQMREDLYREAVNAKDIERL